jgi:hypothetical protein
MVTIAITHCNRRKYLSSVVKSLHPLMSIDNVQKIIIDNCSTEEGTSQDLDTYEADGWEVIRRLDRDWINDEYIAKNEIIQKSKHDLILFLQDDMQFIGTKDFFLQICEEFKSIPIASLSLTGVRKSTVLSETDKRITRNIWSKHDKHFPTTGLFKKIVFDKFGLYRVDWPSDKEFWGRSEDEYDNRLKQYLNYDALTAKAHIPIFLSIWNDPRGGYAFIRGNKRYGHYRSAPNGIFYKHMTDDMITKLCERDVALSFSDVANPDGWCYAADEKGDQVKYPQSRVLEEGPVTDIRESKDT